MRLPLCLAAAMFVASSFATPSAAATLTATSTNPSQLGNFSIVFDDIDNDDLFSLDELMSFSGLHYLGFDLTDLLFVPAIAGFTDDVATTWFFSNADGFRTGFAPTFFTYTTTALPPPPPAVPVPGALALLASGLAALGLVARRRRTA